MNILENENTCGQSSAAGNIAASDPVLVVDTSFGSTVAIVGNDAVIEHDSRSHVERLQPNIDRAVAAAGIHLNDIGTIIVGIGPAPFTGLRAGIVTAQALAFATGATLLGQNVLEPQALWMMKADESLSDIAEQQNKQAIHLVLAINDARRKQLYFALYQQTSDAKNSHTDSVDHAHSQFACLTDSLITVMPIDIDYPDNIVARINTYIDDVANEHDCDIIVDIIGHGVERYQTILQEIAHLHSAHDGSLLEAGIEGVRTFAALAMDHARLGDNVDAFPLYVRRPDVQIPNPLKRVVHAS